jgi:hypothetical protein
VLFTGRLASPPRLASVFVYKVRISRYFNYFHFSLSRFISPILNYFSAFIIVSPVDSIFLYRLFQLFQIICFLFCSCSVRFVFFKIIFIFRSSYFHIDAFLSLTRSRYIFNNYDIFYYLCHQDGFILGINLSNFISNYLFSGRIFRAAV